MASKGVFLVNSPNVKYTKDFIEADYDYQITKVESNGDVLVVSSSSFSFQLLETWFFKNVYLNMDVSKYVFVKLKTTNKVVISVNSFVVYVTMLSVA